MKFKMNNVEYTIKEVSQQEFWDYQVDEQDGYYYGQSHFQTQEVWIDKDLSIEKKRKTLYHELTHVYIREYLTSRDISPDEEVLCDISANSHDIIHKIVEDYFTRKKCNGGEISGEELYDLIMKNQEIQEIKEKGEVKNEI